MIERDTLEIKLIDFGSTTAKCSRTTTTFYGTYKYASPEALNKNPYVPSEQEVWTLGALLYVALFRMDPFANDEEIVGLDISKRIKRIRTAPYGKRKEHPAVKISDEAADAVRVLLEKDPAKRPKIEEITNLPFFLIKDD
jgi:serine/threonine protein kinase